MQIQMLALLLHRPAPPDAQCKATLIVCPLSMLDQWADEIRNRVKGSQLQVNLNSFFSASGLSCLLSHSRQVSVYYGNNRIKDTHWLKKCDVGTNITMPLLINSRLNAFSCFSVLTTYGTLAAEFVSRLKGKGRNAPASLSRPVGCLESISWYCSSLLGSLCIPQAAPYILQQVPRSA